MNPILEANIQKMSPRLVEGMSHVTRWHSRPVLRPQSLAEHCHQVALLAVHLSQDLSAETLTQVMYWALVHDAHEVVYGDIPFPSKVLLGQRGLDLDEDFQDRFWGLADNPLRYLPDPVLDLVDAADVLEAAVYAARWYPEGAAEVRAQAEERVRARLDRAELRGAFTRAMAVLEDLRHG